MPRDCVSGALLLARRLLRGTQGELAALLRAVKGALPVPMRAAVATVLPGVPRQRCQVHALREAAKPLFAAERPATVRPSARARAGATASPSARR